MRVMFLTQWFEPEPAFKGLSFVKGLQARGYEVDVVTGFPNYPRGVLYPGYRLRPWRRETVDGVRITRLFLYPSHSASSVGRALNYVSFFVSALLYGLFAAWRYDLVYVYHPPITVGAAAALFTAIARRPFIIDIQDLWPDSVRASGMSGTGKLSALLGAVCDFVYTRASFIVAQSKGIAATLMARGVPAEKLTTIYNWADETLIAPQGLFDARAWLPTSRFNIVYAGNLGRVQRLDALIDAARLAAQSEPGLLLTLIGDGAEAENLRRLAGEDPHVALRSSLPREQIADALARADALAVHLADDPLFTITVPSKLQFYLASGKPVLAGLAGEAAELVQTAGAGVTAAPGDVAALAAAMLELARRDPDERVRMGASGRAFYDAQLSERAALDATASLLAKFARAPSLKRGLALKRAFDILASGAGLIVLSPVMIAVAIAIVLTMGRPILFRQKRPGLHGRPFGMLKFRSMTNLTDSNGNLLPDGARITRLGAFLRASSLDELPELWNVLRGDMSLVGPRPLLMRYLDRYTAEQYRRHEAPPGITGWAQINGRNAISWPEKLALDVWYVDHRSFVLDLKILALTASKVLRRSDINAGDGVTMPEFLGEAPELTGCDERGAE